ncbi:SH2 domain-containing protein 4A isoform X2 [Anoplopoma fimbria]|uniref:SH2 domain-containing protein 4A isoform X2 n=1 Tax=Anoplopoma fimbria TaxID=229290 RepID=UPI0023EC1EFD|nr:SH2 domain-containing protein 4A isoform X2 [Anoplopoma fimbria]
MLAKILEDMWVEPEVLEALSEEQKRILFLKMREEQVRRWTEREQREEKEGRDNDDRPKKVHNKHVKWLLGRDGDVSVRVIGEVDEFRSSKLLQSLMNNRVHSDNTHGIQTVDLLSGREAKQLGLKEDLSLTDDDPVSPHDRWSEEDCSADDDPKDPTEDSDSESGGSSDNHGDWSPLDGPHFSSHDNRPPLKAQLSETERAGQQDIESSHYGGRVAQLRKTFAEDHHITPASTKPPVPAKPAHLQKSSAPLIPSN